ncbi:MAG: deoxyribonuclease IV [Chlamydiales bacterium]
MTKSAVVQLLLGAHISIAGGLHHAFARAKEINATTMQIFTANQRQWKSKPIPKTELDLWNDSRKKIPLTHLMSHSSYLINLGSNNKELLVKSIDTFHKEIDRCHLLDITYLNFHPGSAKDQDREECLERIVSSLLTCIPKLQHGKTRLLIETTAGQGTSIGSTFEEIGYIIQRVKSSIPIGVCIDTCHAFSAGYDIRGKSGWANVINEFEKKIGISYLYAIHVNDSLHGLGSRKDRHANIGEGQIGLESFEALMKHPSLQPLPKYLETPNGETHWKKEIALLKTFGSIK